MTNTIEDAIQKNNVIFGEKWEMMHDRIDRCSEDIRLLKNQIMDLEALSGLQQNALQSCQSTIAGLEETVLKLAASVTVLEKSVLLNGGSAYGPYDVNRIPLISDPMPAALLSDLMIQLTPIFDIGVVFRIRSIHRHGPKPPSVSRYTAVTIMLLVVYIHVPLYAIHHFAPLFDSTTTSNNLSQR